MFVHTNNESMFYKYNISIIHFVQACISLHILFKFQIITLEFMLD